MGASCGCQTDNPQGRVVPIPPPSSATNRREAEVTAELPRHAAMDGKADVRLRTCLQSLKYVKLKLLSGEG